MKKEYIRIPSIAYNRADGILFSSLYISLFIVSRKVMKDKRIAMKPMIQSKAVLKQFFYLCLYRWLTPKGQFML